MPSTNYSNRIAALKSRRQGQGEYRNLEKSIILDSTNVAILKHVTRNAPSEDYENRSPSTALTYALGAMQEVDKRYTEISREEGSRISSQLSNGMQGKGKIVATELQGSLPLNVHLRRVSDVDILVLPEWFFVFDSSGSASQSYTRSSLNKYTVISELRTDCVEILKNAYPAATVDNKGAKCVTINGGSLRRDVDVVPALWFNTKEYQNHDSKANRGVDIFDTTKYEFHSNYPFKVRALIEYKNENSNDGCKKAIRFLKTLKIDSEKDIKLSSFDIMSIVYAMDNNDLKHSRLFEGKLIISIQNWLSKLKKDEKFLRSLLVVDASRFIIQNDNDVKSVADLSAEVDSLVIEIAKELYSGHEWDLVGAKTILDNAIVR